VFQRFEHARANALWQMDFKGHLLVGEVYCHPLAVLNDHSRFALALRAFAIEQTATAQQVLAESFERYGLPEQMLMDRGSLWP
jgi:hypothetical protein